MSHLNPTQRPWYCNDRTVDEYATALRRHENPKMVKRLKILEGIIVNVGVIAIALVALLFTPISSPYVGPVAVLSILTLAAYNGVAAADYAALVQAYQEIQDEQES